MDHLPRPSQPTSSLPRVPHVCHESYDLGDFLTYPARLGPQWEHAVPGGLQTRFGYVERQRPSDEQELTSFLQCWLFFGLLHALLGGLYDEQHYIEHVNGIPYVHTQRLQEILDLYVQSLPQDRSVIAHRIIQCLAITENMLLQIRELVRANSITLDPAVRTSLVSLYGTITALAQMRLPGYWTQKEGFYDDLSQPDITHMTKHGWCPATIARLLDAGLSLAMQRYVKDLANPDDRSHTSCNSQQCQYEVGAVAPKHTDDCHGCPVIGPDVSDVAQMLIGGGFPVLEIIGDDKEKLKIHLHKREDQRYIALSHVWAHGLGNESDTKLPACQLLRILAYVQALRGREFQHPDKGQVKVGELYIWIDPLLCPRPQVSYEVHQKALSKMRQVYHEATFVLVVDRALENVSCSTVDAMARIHVSDWMSRLWTLQEAALPAKLLIQFADGAVDYFNLFQESKAMYDTDVMLRSMMTTLVAAGSRLRSWRFFEPEERNVQEAFSSLSSQRARQDADQPVCAAALLGLNIDEIVSKTSLEDRMCVFWKLAAQAVTIPSTIVFSPLDQLERPGYRWAPARIIGSTTRLHAVRQSTTAKLTDRGLLVQFAAWRVQCSRQTTALKSLDDKVLGPSSVMHIRTPEGKWYLMSSQEDIRKHQWHMILDPSLTTALLGKMHHGVFRKTARSSMSPYSAEQTILAETAWESGRAVHWNWTAWALWLTMWLPIESTHERYR